MFDPVTDALSGLGVCLNARKDAMSDTQQELSRRSFVARAAATTLAMAVPLHGEQGTPEQKEP